MRRPAPTKVEVQGIALGTPPTWLTVGATHRRTVYPVAGMVEIVVNRLASTPLTNAVHGPATIAWTPQPVKTMAGAIAAVIHPTLQTVGATHPPTMQDASGMAVIAVILHVLMEPTRVALWDTLATTLTPVKTLSQDAHNLAGINLT